MRGALLCCGAIAVGVLAYRIGAQAMATPVDEILSGTAAMSSPRLERVEPIFDGQVRVPGADGSDILLTVTRGGVPVPAFGLDCFREAAATTCYVEEGDDGAFGTTTGDSLKLALEPLAVVTGSVPFHSQARYRHRVYSSLAAVDQGRFEVRIFRGPGTVTIRDQAGRVRITHPVIGTPGARIDLGAVTLD